MLSLFNEKFLIHWETFMKKHIPSISIDTNPVVDIEGDFAKLALQKIERASITPTTLESREFFSQKFKISESDIEEEIQELPHKVETLKKEIEEARKSTLASLNTFKEISEGFIQEVELNNASSTIADPKRLDTKVSILESYIKELEAYKEFLVKNPDLAIFLKDTYGSGNNSVTRLGINTTHISSSQSEELTKIYTPVEKQGGSTASGSGKNKDKISLKMLHPIEVALLREASDILEHNKSVLVDIFARNNDGSIKSKDGKPETHTVVLFKQPSDNKIIIIDPTNSDLSKHISLNSIRIYNQDVTPYKLISPSTEIKIYTPEKLKVGGGFDQYRDCIDITVKIAFGLNELKEVIKDPQSIKSLRVVQEVTNNEDLNPSLTFFDPQEIPLRIMQASESGVRDKTHQLLENIFRQFQLFQTYFKNKPEKTLDIRAENESKLKSINYTPAEYTKAIEDLLSLYHENTELLYKELNQFEASLIGNTGGENEE